MKSHNTLFAMQAGHADTVRELLKPGYGVDVDKKNEDEQSPCHLAATYGHTEVGRQSKN